ncbi:MAG TPA: condensation domain-containing protein, partial [Blastocatellia bacterium]|nr:condensation domain-containing protein [Blastocatellia bacterium]
MSYSQTREWFLQELDRGSGAYNIPLSFELTGQLTVESLEASLGEIVRRHEALRTCFHEPNGELVQIILPAQPLAVPIVDLRDLEGPARVEQEERLHSHQARQPFDLRRGPLIRMALLVLDVHAHSLLVTIHHIACDGWSLGILTRELGCLYETFSIGEQSPLSDLLLQYADYASWQHQWLQGEFLSELVGYWERQLAGAPPLLNLPTDRPRPKLQTFRGKTYLLPLSPPLSDAVREFGRAEGATLFMTLLAAFNAYLWRWTGEEDISLGSFIANRNKDHIESVVGFFVNTIVLRTRLDRCRSFRDLVEDVRGIALGAYAHQDLPFELLLERLQPEREKSHSPLFQLMFVLQNAPRGPLQLSRLTIGQQTEANIKSDFDLTLAMYEGRQGLAAAFEYNTDLFDAGTIARVADSFRILLESAVAKPDDRLSLLRVLSEPEELQFLSEWNGYSKYDHIDGPIQELFEQWAGTMPDAVAITYGAEDLTYGELDRRAKHIASRLLEAGVEHAALVGICMDGSIWMVPALLGALKAGCVYILLDPAYAGTQNAPSDKVSLWLTLESTHKVVARKAVARMSARMICVDSNWQTAASYRGGVLGSQGYSEDAAFASSHSAWSSHRAWLVVGHSSLVAVHREWINSRDPKLGSQRHLQVASFCHDGFSEVVFRAICSGDKLVLLDPKRLSTPAELYTVIRREAVSCAELAPLVLSKLLGHLEATSQSLDSLRLLILSEDECVVEDVAEIWKRCHGIDRLWSDYRVAGVTVAGASPKGPSKMRSCIGEASVVYPVHHTQTLVLDDCLEAVPFGAWGRVYVGGAAIPNRYFDDTLSTCQDFIPNPFTTLVGSRLLRTGWVGRRLADGGIELKGLQNDRVYVRGRKVDMDDVVRAARHHQGVASVAEVTKD